MIKLAKLLFVVVDSIFKQWTNFVIFIREVYVAKCRAKEEFGHTFLLLSGHSIAWSMITWFTKRFWAKMATEEYVSMVLNKQRKSEMLLSINHICFDCLIFYLYNILCEITLITGINLIISPEKASVPTCCQKF